MHLSVLGTDLKLKSEGMAFLELSPEQGEQIESSVHYAYQVAREFASKNIIIISETDEMSVAAVDVNPKSAEIRSQLESEILSIAGEKKGQFLLNKMSMRFLIDLARFGESQMLIRIKPMESGHSYHLWHIKKGLFASVEDLASSDRLDDPSIAKFQGNFKSRTVPVYLQALVDDGSGSE